MDLRYVCQILNSEQTEESRSQLNLTGLVIKFPENFVFCEHIRNNNKKIPKEVVSKAHNNG